MQRNARWITPNGTERAQVTKTVEGYAIAGITTNPDTHYRILLDTAWHTNRVEVTTNQGTLSLHVERGRWLDDTGLHLAHLDGCIDVDLAHSAMTHTLPLRRVRLKYGQTLHLRVAYIDGLALRAGYQTYTRLDKYRYLFSSGHLETTITVNDDKFVTDYPELFTKI